MMYGAVEPREREVECEQSSKATPSPLTRSVCGLQVLYGVAEAGTAELPVTVRRPRAESHAMPSHAPTNNLGKAQICTRIC